MVTLLKGLRGLPPPRRDPNSKILNKLFPKYRDENKLYRHPV